MIDVNVTYGTNPAFPVYFKSGDATTKLVNVWTIQKDAAKKPVLDWSIRATATLKKAAFGHEYLCVGGKNDFGRDDNDDLLQ